MEKKRTDCPALPPGWKKEEVIRKSGLSAGKSDVYYYSPTGKKFRSKPQLARYLGNAVDLACFDFRTGKMMPGKLQKSKQRIRPDAQSLAKGAKPDLNTTLPIRQTASIFKQPVTKVTGHPGNRVKADPQRPAEPPRQVRGAAGRRHGDRWPPAQALVLQLFWEKRLTGLRPSDVAEEVLRGLDPPRGPQGRTRPGGTRADPPTPLTSDLSAGIGPGGRGAALLAAIAGALHLGAAPGPAQKNQALCRGFAVTDQQIRDQELKVFQARRSLEEALTADGLARAAENSRELLLLPGKTA